MTEEEKAAFAEQIKEIEDHDLAFIAQKLLYQSMGKFAAFTDEQKQREKERQTECWIKASLCRAEMWRRAKLKEHGCKPGYCTCEDGWLP